MTRERANKILREVYAENRDSVSEDVKINEVNGKVFITNILRCNTGQYAPARWEEAKFDISDYELTDWRTAILKESAIEFMEATGFSLVS